MHMKDCENVILSLEIKLRVHKQFNLDNEYMKVRISNNERQKMKIVIQKHTFALLKL